MVQRIFDIENEKDYTDLWNIVPKDVETIERSSLNTAKYITTLGFKSGRQYIKINWHDKTEITKHAQEATEADIGKLCMFWDYEDMPHYGVLRKIDEESIYKDGVNLWKHCRRLTKQEIEELC